MTVTFCLEREAVEFCSVQLSGEEEEAGAY